MIHFQPLSGNNLIHHSIYHKMIRTGIGYDVHQLVEGRPLVLGGVTIPFKLGLAGHSDADVLAHAIADALLGALGEPDIGYWFPPTDASIEGIDSMDILRKVRAIADDHGAVIHNVDSTLIAEEPKIKPHITEMKQCISEALSIAPSQVGVKATTNETMGFPGRQEGMCAMAVACADVPVRD
ncbi:MAG: 2-C-methyl-D-erythritol 2,4-cyclodiphosphate synthase [Verrucomicrobiales bacterium]